ncbi:MAG: class I SAM-dependent methyltransferase [Thalassobaculaceae bacterium]
MDNNQKQSIEEKLEPRGKRPVFWEALLDKWLSRIEAGELRAVFPSNFQKVYSGGQVGPTADIKINSWKLVPRLLLSGDMGLAESFLSGEWETSNLTQLILLGDINERALGNAVTPSKFINLIEKLRHQRRDNSKRGSRRNIAAHYDLGNEFYSHWLDNSMSYSSALFTDFGEELEVGQNRKYQRLAKALKLKEGDQVLEIGCGWGGFAEIAAKEYKCNVVGITLSNEQAKFAQRRMQENQLSNLVDIRIEDYRDVQGSFDKIVSIEMLEAVGEEHWRNYFETIKTRLKPGGLAGIQSITIANEFFETYKRRPDFIQKYIFPGGILPSEDKLNNAVSSAGLKILDDYYFGKSYAETLRRWQSTFEQKWDDIKNLGFDEKFQKMWRYYLSYCEAGFESGHINVGQFLIGSK